MPPATEVDGALCLEWEVGGHCRYRALVAARMKLRGKTPRATRGGLLRLFYLWIRVN